MSDVIAWKPSGGTHAWLHQGRFAISIRSKGKLGKEKKKIERYGEKRREKDISPPYISWLDPPLVA